MRTFTLNTKRTLQRRKLEYLLRGGGNHFTIQTINYCNTSMEVKIILAVLAP